MKRKWLIFDMSNLAWRAHYSTGQMSFNDNPTGVLYGVLREVRTCMAKFRTDDCVFCFDSGKSYRSEYYPWYKESRQKRKVTENEEQQLLNCRTQIDQLKDTHLHQIGFDNVLLKRGYEADDIIASVCFNLGRGESAVIVTGDEDLYQCLQHKRVNVYHPAKREEVTAEGFQIQYGIRPELWPKVKAIAGCKSDDVPGVGGFVGEKTACQYLAGKEVSEKKAQRIRQEAKRVEENLKVVTLPYPGTPVFDLIPDCKIDRRAWENLMDELGFTTLKDQDMRGGWLPVRGPDAIRKELKR